MRVAQHGLLGHIILKTSDMTLKQAYAQAMEWLYMACIALSGTALVVITLIIPYPPGGSADMLARPMLPDLQKALGQTINGQLIASANMVTDFWYTAWVNAGKPSLATSRDLNTDLEMELKSFKSNALINDGLLISKKSKPED